MQSEAKLFLFNLKSVLLCPYIPSGVHQNTQESYVKKIDKFLITERCVIFFTLQQKKKNSYVLFDRKKISSRTIDHRVLTENIGLRHEEKFPTSLQIIDHNVSIYKLITKQSTEYSCQFQHNTTCMDSNSYVSLLHYSLP